MCCLLHASEQASNKIQDLTTLAPSARRSSTKTHTPSNVTPVLADYILSAQPSHPAEPGHRPGPALHASRFHLLKPGPKHRHHNLPDLLSCSHADHLQGHKQTPYKLLRSHLDPNPLRLAMARAKSLQKLCPQDCPWLHQDDRCRPPAYRVPCHASKGP